MAGLWESYFRVVERRPWLLLGLLGCLGLLAVYPVSQLELRTDFTELLPKEHPAAVAIREVMPRQLSSTNLVLIIESPDRQANRRFAEALRPALQSLVGKLFSEVTYRPDTEVADAAALHKWHYAELSELGEAEQLLDRLLGETESQIDPDDVAALCEKAVENAPALTPKCELGTIGKPREQSKQRDADPGGPIHRMIGTAWTAPRMFCL